MSHLPAFRQYQNFIQQATEPKPKKKAKPKAETANGLTKKIVLHIRANGGFATRLQSTGLYRADLKRYVESQQVGGMGDVVAVINSHFVSVEVKIGRDKLSEQQIRTIAALEQAGASCFVAHSFDEFETWFTALLASRNP